MIKRFAACTLGMVPYAENLRLAFPRMVVGDFTPPDISFAHPGAASGQNHWLNKFEGHIRIGNHTLCLVTLGASSALLCKVGRMAVESF